MLVDVRYDQRFSMIFPYDASNSWEDDFGLQIVP